MLQRLKNFPIIRNSLIETSELISSTIIFFYTSLVLISTLLFIVGQSLSQLVVLSALLITLIYFWLAGKKIKHLDNKTFVISLGIVIAIFTLAYNISSYFYDMSWDGRDYQQKAIRQLSAGWNPIYTEQEPRDIYYNVWLNHYPKAPWIAAAAFYKLTGNIETGKIFNILLVTTVFFTSFAFFLKNPRINFWLAISVSFVLAANPVSICQTLSYYVDGQVSSIFTLLVILMLDIYKRPNLILYITIICVIVLGLNIKFNGTAYIIALMAIMLMLSYITNFIKYSALLRQKEITWRNIGIYLGKALYDTRRMLLILTFGCVIGGFVVGLNPYVTNMIRYGNPLYPVYGSNQFNKEYIVAPIQMPANFMGENSLKKLFLSIFSYSSYVSYPDESGPLKIPFTVTTSELNVFLQGYGVRVGGFGPLFGGLVILSVVALIVSFANNFKIGVIGLGMICVILVTAFLNSELWWARYAPQLWLIPIISCLTGMLNKKRLWERVFLNLMLSTIFLNIFIVGGSYLKGNIHDTNHVKAILNKLANQEEEILVYHGVLDAIETKLNDYHIEYKIVQSINELPCPYELEPFTYYSYKSCAEKHPIFYKPFDELLVEGRIPIITSMY